MRNRSGMTLIELLAAIGLFWILLLGLAPGLRSFFARLEARSALRAVTSGLSTARYTAIRDNQPVRVEIAANRLLLSQESGPGWRVVRCFDLGGSVIVRANSRPVFSPLGSASPLCTITLENRERICRVVVSMFGRVRVYGDI